MSISGDGENAKPVQHEWLVDDRGIEEQADGFTQILN